MKLYEITQQHKELQALVESEELTQDMVADTFEGIEGLFNDKAASVVALAANMDSDVSALDAEIKRLTDRKKAINNKQDNIREYLRVNMENSGITNIKCPLFSITLAKGRDILVIDKAEEIPVEYVDTHVVETPDKRRILADLKAGNDIPGCRVEKSKTSLRIK